MRALWLNRFDYSGNAESVAELAEGFLKKGLKIHLVLNGVPPSLTGTYQEYMDKKGLKSSVNISTQQIQNMLYYQGCKLLHVFHPAFFPLAQNLSSSLKINWVASCLESIGHSAYSSTYSSNYSALAGATFITCSSTALWKEIKSIFHPYKKEKVLLIPPGIKIPLPEFSREGADPSSTAQPDKLRLLYIGPLESNRLAVFFRLNKLIAGLKDCDFGMISAQRISGISGTLYPWTPDWDSIARSYDIIISSGFFLLRAIAKGKIALLMEEKYGGIFSPRAQVQVPDFRATLIDKDKGNGTGAGAGAGAGVGTGAGVGAGAGEDLLKRDLQELQKLLEQPSAVKRLQEENWNYARENHDLEIVSEQLARLYSRLL